MTRIIKYKPLDLGGKEHWVGHGWTIVLAHWKANKSPQASRVGTSYFSEESNDQGPCSDGFFDFKVVYSPSPCQSFKSFFKYVGVIM